MNNYYFVAPSLPPLLLGEAPEMTLKEVMCRLEVNLSKEDLEKVATIRRLIDLENIRSLYLGKPLDDHGNLSEKELDEALLVNADLPDYVFEFLSQFDEPKQKAGHFFGLLSCYYSHEIPKAKGFLRDLLQMQRDMRLILAAIRAKKVGRDISKELQFEDFADPIVAHILAQKDMDSYDAPVEYQDLAAGLAACGADSWQQHQSVVEYEVKRIEEMTEQLPFSIDWILGYIARLLLVHRWNALSLDQGKTILDRYKTGS